MYIKGIPDYSRDGKQKETGLFAGLVSQDGELKQTQNGKEFGSASVRAFNRKDGTAAFMTIKSFGDYARLISNLRKGDHILCGGVVESREYNGKTYTDMLVDFLMASDAMPAETVTSPSENRAALTRRMDSAGFAEIDDDIEKMLPF